MSAHSAVSRRAVRSHGRIALAGTASLITLLCALAAHAADTPQLAHAAAAAVDEIIVTGTRVVRDGYQAPTPV